MGLLLFFIDQAETYSYFSGPPTQSNFTRVNGCYNPAGLKSSWLGAVSEMGI